VSRFLLIAGLIALALISACVPIRAPEQDGFLSTYENLDVVGKDRLFYPGSRVGEYGKFIIDPTKLLFTPDPDEARFTTEELSDLLEYFDNAVLEQLSKENHNGPGYESNSARKIITDRVMKLSRTREREWREYV